MSRKTFYGSVLTQGFPVIVTLLVPGKSVTIKDCHIIQHFSGHGSPFNSLKTVTITGVTITGVTITGVTISGKPCIARTVSRNRESAPQSGLITALTAVLLPPTAPLRSPWP